jgi:hypothetical protein
MHGQESNGAVLFQRRLLPQFLALSPIGRNAKCLVIWILDRPPHGIESPIPTVTLRVFIDDGGETSSADPS